MPGTSDPAISPVSTLEAPVQDPQPVDLLRLVICGSVDDGKSTLLGRLLQDAGQIPGDQLAALESDSRRHGTRGEAIDLALVVDGLEAEREQGITIDVAYRSFASRRRRFIVADTPGHEQYTRNMVTAASTAQAAVLLVDVRAGLLTQTRRHATLVSLMGIRHVALAVNKMDLLAYRQDAFDAIRQAFADFTGPLGFASVTAIPLSALQGDNLMVPKGSMPWYRGPTLVDWLDAVDTAPRRSDRLVFPVQWVNRPNAEFRGYSGTLAAGSVRPGDTLRVTASGHTARVTGIHTMDGRLDLATAGRAVTLTLDREIDISRGDVLSQASQPLDSTDQFEATVVWMDPEPGLVGRCYDLKLGCQWVQASLTQIKYRLDVDTRAHEAARSLRLNDIAVCHVSITRTLAFDTYEACPALGAFILVDRFSNATVAAGMIRHSLHRVRNVHRQALAISRAEREQLNGHRGLVAWFTGLSGSGKSTLANALELKLHQGGMRTYVLDGDNVRQGLNRDLGFTDADRVENIRRVAEVARLMADAGLVVLTAFISPFARERAMARDIVGAERFVEIFVATPLQVCEQRDVKGLYRKARAGEIPDMTGIDSPYEPPDRPDHVADAWRRPIDQLVTELEELVRSRSSRPAG